MNPNPPTLRPYQQEAVRAVIEHFRGSDEPAVVVLPTGAGKSLVIAELARLARGAVLVLAHVKELVEQNLAKYEYYGFQAGVFSAGLGRKELAQKVTFASIQSVSAQRAAFGWPISLVVIDECHRVALDEQTQYQALLAQLRTINPKVKILGLTATPYRLDIGWIYRRHLPKRSVRTQEPTPFAVCVYELSLATMIDQGYLTPARLLDAPIALYDFMSQRAGANPIAWNEGELDQLLRQARRVTPAIVQQLITLGRDRQGVMIFAATVAHAREILGLLPPECSALIVGTLSQRARDSVIEAFKQRQIKYLVNVSVLTTGFDAPHVDLIAILRPTESVGLFQQIVGRGLRLAPGKTDCLVIDYAGNGFDLHSPEVGSQRPKPGTVPVQVPCPLCEHLNEFWGITDRDGDLIEHFGRRCQGLVEGADGGLIPCDYRYRYKLCGHCGAENDIAARQCHQCQALLVDADQKLRDALQLKDAKVIRCSGLTLARADDARGERLRITYHDEEGAELVEHFRLSTAAQRYAFKERFWKPHLRDSQCRYFPETVEEALAGQALLRWPDFVIARQYRQGWRISDRLFDYEGAFRRAEQLR